MAAIAAVSTENMGGMLGRASNTTAALVATGAGTGRALEDGINVTALAGYIVVLANELKPGREVVEGTAHLGRSGCAPPQRQQTKAGN